MSPATARLALALAVIALAAQLPRAPQAPPPPPAAAPAGAAGLLFGARLDLDRASAEDLEVLPGIGGARARAIVAERRRGPYCRVAALARVRGIGPRTLARIAPWLRASGCAAGAPAPGRAAGN